MSQNLAAERLRLVEPEAPTILETPTPDVLAAAQRIKTKYERRVPGVAFVVDVVEFSDGYRRFEIRHA